MIYIQKDLEPLIDKEPNVSGLINNLVREHFKKVAGKVEELASVGIRSTLAHDTDFKKMKYTTTVVPNEADVGVFKERIERVSSGFCKNGHSIPKGRSKCLGKGCKYA